MKAQWWLPLLALALAAGWWLGSRLQAPPAALRLPPVEDCQLQAGPCSARLPGGGQVRLALAPLPAKVMIPLTLDLALDAAASAVWVDFVGLNMDMGFNRAELAPADRGLWQGQVILPVCSAAEMRWEARVFIAGKDGLLEVPFILVTRP